MKNTNCQRISADVHASASIAASAALDEQWTQTIFVIFEP